MGKRVLIIGSSGHARVIIDIFERAGAFQIVGLIDDYRPVGALTLGYAVLGGLSDVSAILADNPGCDVFVAIGDNAARKAVVHGLRRTVSAPHFASAIHPNSIVSRSVHIGEGVAIMAGAVVNSASRLGDFSIVNTQSSVDHDCVIGEFSSIAPGAVLGGTVSVGVCSAIGIGATIKNGVAIGGNVVVGAGALVLKDCTDNTLIYGVPARVVREREEGDPYL